MRVAISTDGNDVSAHFGRCPSFTIVDIENGEIKGREEVQNPGHHPGFLPKFLHDKGVNCIVAGGMGQNAVQLFHERGIEGIVGISGSIDEVIGRLVSGGLEGGESLCKPGVGKGYGLDKTVCDHPEDQNDKEGGC